MMGCLGRGDTVLSCVKALATSVYDRWLGPRPRPEQADSGEQCSPNLLQDIASVFHILDENTPLLPRVNGEIHRYLERWPTSAVEDTLSETEADPPGDQCHEGPLCEHCRKLVKQIRNNDLRVDRSIHYDDPPVVERIPHLSYNSLSHSQHNCVLCAKIWIRLPHEDYLLQQALSWLVDKPGLMLRELKDHTMLLSGWAESTHFRIQVLESSEIRAATERQLDTPIDFYAPEGFSSWTLRREAPLALNIGQSHSGHQSFRKRLKKVNAWLKECESSHTFCRHWRGTEDQWLPTRLVEVGETSTETRLRVSAELPKGTRYATLSHCWGAKSFTKLTNENLKDWHTSIPVLDLPSTFKEALEACRDLNIDYLWVDSLCIKQDSRQDWAREASAMHLVYRHSFLNLAAGASNEASGGLFRAYNSFLSANPLMQNVRGIHFTGGPSLSHFQDKESIRLDFQQSRLHRRAWVVQELFLSPRTLHFTSLNLWWQCKERMFSLWRFPNDSLREIGRGLPCVYTFGGDQRDGTDLRASWLTLIEDYSAADLSYPEDKVIAFDGLSQFFVERVKMHSPEQHLLAGLWAEQICFDLLWFTASRNIIGSLPSGPLIFLLDENRASRHRSDYSMTQARPRNRVAPSWSWLSTSVPVSCSLTQYVGDIGWFAASEGFRPCAQIVRTELALDSSHCYKSSSSMTLRAPWFSIRVENRLPYLFTQGTQITTAMRTDQIANAFNSSKTRRVSQHGEEGAHIQCFFDDAHYHYDGSLYCCVATLQHEAMPWIFRGIIVQELDNVNEDFEAYTDRGEHDDRHGRLERVGIWCSDASWIDRDHEQLKQLRWIQTHLMKPSEMRIH